MLTILIVIFVAIVVYQSAFADGKRIGSRKGYGVGFDRGSRNKSGCLFAVIGFVLVIGTVASAIACCL